MSAAASSPDAGHVDLLGIFHYVVAALTAFFALFPVIHLLIGLGLVTGRLDGAEAGTAEARLAGWVFIAVAVALITLGMAAAALFAYAGRCLRARRRHTLCMVSAGIACLFMPFGTVLGVFTLVVLARPGVQAMFD